VDGPQGLAGAGIGLGHLVLGASLALRTRRPPSTTGSTARGMPMMASAASFGLVTTSITRLPDTVTMLRRATDMLLLTTPRSSSVSAESRDTSSAERERS
jgi:hypothetical protein